MVREAGCQAPGALFTDKFIPGVKYTWQVKGYDPEGCLVSEGAIRSFIAR
jgi:hypothetical protein